MRNPLIRQLFSRNGILRVPVFRSRGLRSITFLCCILTIICVIFTLIISFVTFIIHTYIVYTNFVRTFPFSTVPFWQDNRTIIWNSLRPVLKVEDVNVSTATIVITACCRDVRKNLAGFQRNMQAITALFGDYRIYFSESDSRDKTLEFLHEWEKNDTKHVRVHTDGQQRRRIPSRKFLLTGYSKKNLYFILCQTHSD